MAETTTVGSLKDLLRFPFRDPNWQSRFLMGAGLVLVSCFIPILPTLPVLGYTLAVMRRAVQGEEPTLPAWDDWGQLIVDGLRVLAVEVVFLLPGILVMAAGMVFYFAGTIIMPLLSALKDPGAALLAVLFLFGGVAVMFVGMALGMLLMLLGAIPLPLATAHLAARDQVSAAFRVREWWPILRANKLGYFVAWVVVAGLFAISYAAGMIAYYTICLCFLMPVILAPASFYTALVGAALFGQAYREGAAVAAQTEEPAAA